MANDWNMKYEWEFIQEKIAIFCARLLFQRFKADDVTLYKQWYIHINSFLLYNYGNEKKGGEINFPSRASLVISSQ